MRNAIVILYIQYPCIHGILFIIIEVVTYYRIIIIIFQLIISIIIITINISTIIFYILYMYLLKKAPESTLMSNITSMVFSYSLILKLAHFKVKLSISLFQCTNLNYYEDCYCKVAYKVKATTMVVSDSSN